MLGGNNLAFLVYAGFLPCCRHGCLSITDNLGYRSTGKDTTPASTAWHNICESEH